MKPGIKSSALVVSVLAMAAPLLAQDADGAREPTVERKVVVIDKTTSGGHGDHHRKVEVRRIRKNETASDGGRNQVEVRVSSYVGGDRLAKGEPADIETLILDSDELDCENAGSGDVAIRVCSSEGNEMLVEALREARAEIAGESELGEESRRRALTALDARIAALEAELSQ